MKKILYLSLLFFLLIISLDSCSNTTEEEKQYIKLEKIYNKKGLQGFAEEIVRDKYVAIKLSQENGATPLLIAVKNNELQLVKIFIENGASPIKEKDNQNKDFLDYAIEFQKNEVNNLLEILPSDYWNTKDSDGNLPVVRLIQYSNSYTAIKSAIKKTENIEAKNDKDKTVLMYAAQYNIDVRILKMILDSLVNINEKNINEWTAAMYAARYNPNPTIVSDLLLRGADKSPNSVGISLTMLAACNPNPGVLLKIISELDEINLSTDQGKTAMMYACENQQSAEHINLLLDNNVNINSADNEGKTALMYALENYTEPDIAYLLIAAGADCTAEDKNGKTVSDYLQKNVSLKKSELSKIILMSQNNGEKSTEKNITEDSLAIQLENDYEAKEDSSEEIDDKEILESETEVDSVNSSVEISDEELGESGEKNEASID